jgi:hypothetical protein
MIDTRQGACVGPREILVDGCKGLFGCTGFTKGCDESFECDGSRRGEKHPKDAMFHIDDPWSPYKSTRVHNQGRQFLESRNKGGSLRQGKIEAELQKWKTSNQGWDALEYFGEVWKHMSVGGMCEVELKFVLAW